MTTSETGFDGPTMTHAEILKRLVNVPERFASYRKLADLPRGYLLTDRARRGEMTLLILAVGTWIAFGAIALAVPLTFVIGPHVIGLAGFVVGGEALVWSWGLEEIYKGNVYDSGPFMAGAGDIRGDTCKAIWQLQVAFFGIGIGVLAASAQSFGLFAKLFAR